MEGSALQNEAVPALKGEAVFQDTLPRNSVRKKIYMILPEPGRFDWD